MDGLSEKTVLDACAGDRAALQLLLCDQYDRLAKRIAVKMPPSMAKNHSVDDVLQETFLQAIRDVDKCRATNVAQFAAWLSSIADHRIVDLARAAGRKKRGGDRKQVTATAASSMMPLSELVPDAGATASSRMGHREAGDAIHDNLESLPEAQRKAIEMRFLKGNELKEIADELNTSPAAVRGLLYRAQRSLREAMGRSSRWFRKK